MKKFVIAAALALIAGSATTNAQQTARLTATKANEYGLIYTLPRTEVSITIAARKTLKTPGEFAKYAVKYLGTKPVLQPSVEWEITDVVIAPEAVADDSEKYLVTLKGGNGTFITITDDGFPLAVNDASYDGGYTSPSLPEAVAPVPTILEGPEARQAMTPEMIQSRSSAKRAELAAAKIYELRSSRGDIISGQADAMPSDGEAMKLALERIDRQEAALTAMFTGTEQTSVEVRTYTLTLQPDSAGSVRTVVARLSALDGLVDASDLSGAPVYATVTPTSVGRLPVNEKGVEKTFPKGGVAYRIPGTADVSVSFRGKTLASRSIDVAQYGVVFGLDPAIFTSRKSTGYLHFNPLTGAIREVGTLEE